MTPVLRILLTVLAGAWMVFWIIFCGKQMIKFLAELMGEEDKEKEDKV